MLALDTSAVPHRRQSEAIRQVGELLATSGNIEPGYIASMLDREKNTFLGSGIAIPHGSSRTGS